MTRFFELQPLRLAAGWTIEYNDFTEYDLDKHGKEYSYELHEDLLQLCLNSKNLRIDLGWYPNADENGCYVLVLIKNSDWNLPLQEVRTRSKQEIIACIEKWTHYEFYSKYL